MVVAGCLVLALPTAADSNTDAAVALVRYALGGQVIDDAAA